MPATASPLLNLSNPGLSKPQVKTGLDANTGASDRGFSHILGQAIKTPRTQPRTEHGHGNSVPQGKNLPSKGNADTRLKKQEANRDDARSTLPQEVKQASTPADDPAADTSDLKDSPVSDSSLSDAAIHQKSSAAKEDEKTSGLVEDQLASELAPWLMQVKQQSETPDDQTTPKSGLDGEITVEAMDVLIDQAQDPVPTQPLVNQETTNALDEQGTPELPSWLVQARAQPAALDGQPLESSEDVSPTATDPKPSLLPSEASAEINSTQDHALEKTTSLLHGQEQITTNPVSPDPQVESSTEDTQGQMRQAASPRQDNPDPVENTQQHERSAKTKEAPVDLAQNSTEAPKEAQAEEDPQQPKPDTGPAEVRAQSPVGVPERKTQASLAGHPEQSASNNASSKVHGKQTQATQDGGLEQGSRQRPETTNVPSMKLDQEQASISTETGAETRAETGAQASQGTMDTGDKASGQSTTAELSKDFSQLLAAGAARTQAGSRGPSQASELPPSMRSLDTPMGSKAWEQGVGERIHWMLGNGLAKAEIRLNPQHLGPLEIRISLQNDQTHVSILAQHGATKDAIEASLPRLREMFQDANLNLGTVDVGRREAQQQGGYQNLHHNQAQNQDQDQEKAEREGQGRGRHRFAQAEEDDLTDFRRPASRLSSALIDDFA